VTFGQNNNMRIIRSISEMVTLSKDLRRKGRTIGFTPTMGALHEGHLTLVRKSVSECAVSVVSIFVNPIQFGPDEDFDKYPRDSERDIELLSSSGCDILFTINKEEMYPQGFQTWVDLTDLGNHLCGFSRPIHFRGVTTVVAKLFNIVSPDKAYFGWKDAQQVLIIKQMVKDLNMQVEISAQPTVRESDGLALSSRNAYLSDEERKIALFIPNAIKRAKEYFQNGERNATLLLEELYAFFTGQNNTKVDYISLVDIDDLENVEEITNRTLLAIAVKVGSTRLIDNHLFSEDEQCSE